MRNIPDSYSCMKDEKSIKCTHNSLVFISFAIKYLVKFTGTLDSKSKSTKYVITLSNIPKDINDFGNYHLTQRFIVTKSEKQTDLLLRLAEILNTKRQDGLNRSFLNELENSRPAFFNTIIDSNDVKDIRNQMFSVQNPKSTENSFEIEDFCKLEAASEIVKKPICKLEIYTVSAEFIRINIRIGRLEHNYSISKIRFHENFPTIKIGIIRQIQQSLESAVQSKQYPINFKDIKNIMKTRLKSSCQNCELVLGTDTTSAELHQFFSVKFKYQNTLNDKKATKELQEYSIFAINYPISNTYYVDVILDSGNTQTELMLYNNQVTFSREFNDECQVFYNENKEAKTNPVLDLDLGILFAEFETQKVSGSCKSGKIENIENDKFYVECNDTRVIRIEEIDSEEENVIRINFLVIPKNIKTTGPNQQTRNTVKNESVDTLEISVQKQISKNRLDTIIKKVKNYLSYFK